MDVDVSTLTDEEVLAVYGQCNESLKLLSDEWKSEVTAARAAAAALQPDLVALMQRRGIDTMKHDELYVKLRHQKRVQAQLTPTFIGSVIASLDEATFRAKMLKIDAERQQRYTEWQAKQCAAPPKRKRAKKDKDATVALGSSTATAVSSATAPVPNLPSVVDDSSLLAFDEPQTPRRVGRYTARPLLPVSRPLTRMEALCAVLYSVVEDGHRAVQAVLTVSTKPGKVKHGVVEECSALCAMDDHDTTSSLSLASSDGGGSGSGYDGHDGGTTTSIAAAARTVPLFCDLTTRASAASSRIRSIRPAYKRMMQDCEPRVRLYVPRVDPENCKVKRVLPSMNGDRTITISMAPRAGAETAVDMATETAQHADDGIVASLSSHEDHEDACDDKDGVDADVDVDENEDDNDNNDDMHLAAKRVRRKITLWDISGIIDNAVRLACAGHEYIKHDRHSLFTYDDIPTLTSKDVLDAVRVRVVDHTEALLALKALPSVRGSGSGSGSGVATIAVTGMTGMTGDGGEGCDADNDAVSHVSSIVSTTSTTRTARSVRTVDSNSQLSRITIRRTRLRPAAIEPQTEVVMDVEAAPAVTSFPA